MEIDSDVYDNIPNTDNNDLYEEIEKLQQQNNLLQDLINSLEGDIEKLCTKITEMKKIQDNLSRNISELFKTAKAELERKDRTIAELRSQLDSFFQRRNNNFSIKRERDKSPNVAKVPPEHVAKKMRHDDENRTKRSHFKRSRSRSRSAERNRRTYPYKDRRDRFDRHKYDHDSRRVNMRDEKYMERGYKSKIYDSRDYDKKEVTKREITEMERRVAVEKKSVVVMTEGPKKKQELDKREVVTKDSEETAKLKNSLENEHRMGTEVPERNVKDTKMDKIIDNSESVKRDAKESAKVTNSVETVEMVEELKDKKKTTIEYPEEARIRNNVGIEDTLNETAAQRIENERNKDDNSVKEDVIQVTLEKNTIENEIKRKRGPDQKKIVVKRNIKGIIVESNVVLTKCSDNEECFAEGKEKNATPLHQQNEENLMTKSTTKVNIVKIEEVTKKLHERLEEDLKQDPEKATSSLQLTDFVEIDAEVKKSKIGEVTRRLFGDEEDEDKHKTEATPTSVKTVVAEISKKCEAKDASGVKIEALTKKLMGRLEAKKDLEKSGKSIKVDDVREDESVKSNIEDVPKKLVGKVGEEAEHKEEKAISASPTNAVEIANKNAAEEVSQNLIEETIKVAEKPIRRSSKLDNFRENEKSKDEIIKTTNEEMFEKLFGSMEESDQEQKADATVANKKEKEVDKNKSDEVTQKSSGRSSGKIKHKPIRRSLLQSNNVGEDNDKNKEEIIKTKMEEVSKMFGEVEEEENQKPTSVSSAIANSEDIANTNGKDVNKNKVELFGRADVQKSTPGFLKLDSFSEFDYKSKDKINQMKIEEMSKNLFRQIVDEGKDEKQKATSVSSTVNHAADSLSKNEEKDVSEEKSDEVATKSKGEDLVESIKNSVDFTKKRHAMMYGEVSKEISMYRVEGVLSKKQETSDTSVQSNKKEKVKDIKEKVNVKHKEKKKISTLKNDSDQKNKEEKSQKVGKLKKSDTLKNESSKRSKDVGKKKEGQPEPLNDLKVDKEEKSSSLMQIKDNRNTSKEVFPTEQKDEGKKKSVLMESDSKHNKEVPSADQKVEVVKSENPKKPSPKEPKPTADTKLKITKETTRSNSRCKADMQNEDNRNISNEVVSKDQSDKGEKKCIVPMKSESSKHNKEKTPEVPPIHQKVGVEKPETPKKSILKETKPTPDTKSKKTKEATRRDSKCKDDDSSGSIIEESDRVLRSATRRSSRLQEETQKKNPNEATNLKNKKSCTTLDLNPNIEASDFISVNLSHDGEIPVLHITEDSHLVRNSTLLNLENCPPLVTSSPIKSDLNTSFNLSGSNGSNSFGETRVFNTSSGKKRRRVILTMID